jgi:hypothetical protein
VHRRITVAIAAVIALAVVSAALAGPASTAAPKLVGTVAFDQTITCDPGSFTPAPASVAYSWTVSGSPIPGETTNRLVVDKPFYMGGYSLGCTVTATDAAGSTTSVSSPAVQAAPGRTTLKITSVKIRNKGAFVITGRLGPAHLVSGSVNKTKYLTGAQIVLNRRAPSAGPKAVFQLSDGKGGRIDGHGHFTITGHDKAGRRAVIVNFYPGPGATGLWAPVAVTRTIRVTPGYTGSGGFTVGTR